MREKVSQVRNDGKRSTFGRPLDKPTSKRLDLNDLLRRAKDEKKNDKKYNLLILSGAVFVVALFLLLLSL